MKQVQVLKPYFRTEEIVELIRECCDSGWTGIGGKMIEFERAWRAYSGAETCHMLNSATAGLQLAILQLKRKYGWQEGEAEIVTTPITFVSTNHAILYNNLVPVFADTDDSGCLDPEDVVRKLTPRTKAVLFVGLGGNVGRLRDIMPLCRDRGLRLILDAAHMSGTKWVDGGNQVGCSEEGIDVAVFSGQAVKNLPTFDSGWICFNGVDAAELDRQVRQLAWLGIDKDTFSRTSQGTYKWSYDVPEVGFKFHGNAIAGAFGLVGLKYLDADNEYRRSLVERYLDRLSCEGRVRIVRHSDQCHSARHLFQVLIEDRDSVVVKMGERGIFCGVHFRDNTLYKMYSSPEGACPNAREFSDSAISLPLHMHMSVDDVDLICDSLLTIVKKA